MELSSVRIADRFFKEVPRTRYKLVHESIKEFLQDYTKAMYISDMPRNYDIKTLKGTQNEIFKFRYSEHKGDRISFMRFHIEDEGECIVFIRYTDHDKQVRINKNIDIKNLKYRHLGITNKELIENEKLIGDDFINDSGKFEYDFYKEFTYMLDEKFLVDHTIDESKLASLILNAKKEYLYTLTKEQKKHLKDSYGRPYLLSGGAGSGKTTLCAYKLLEFTKGNPHVKGLYYSYSEALIKQGKKIYDKYNLSEEEQVLFCNFDYFKDKHVLKNIIGFEEFEKFVNTLSISEIQKNQRIIDGKKKSILDYNSSDLWTEIHAIIKGGMGQNYERASYLDKEMIECNHYKEEFGKYAIFSKEEKEHIYSFAKNSYQNWLNKNEYIDYNDALRIVLKKEEKEQYDFLVIDEVQDLTKLEIYFLYTLLKSNKKQNLFIVGDEHQIISPSFFRFNYIRTLFHVEHKNKKYDKVHHLSSNLRCQKHIVNYANSISRIREVHIGDMGEEEEIKPNIMDGLPPMLLQFNNQEKSKLMNYISDGEKAYISVITGNENTKSKLVSEYPDLSERIYTVQEMKGLEARYIICYNIISDDYEIWTKILKEIKSNKTEHRKYFGYYYVATTRAQENLYFLEERAHDFYKELIEYGAEFETIKEFSSDGLNIETMVESFDYINLASKHEVDGKYISASNNYMKAQDKENAIRCRILHMENNNDYNEFIKTTEFIIENCAADYNKFEKYKETLDQLGFDVSDVLESLSDKGKIGYLEILDGKLESFINRNKEIDENLKILNEI